MNILLFGLSAISRLRPEESRLSVHASIRSIETYKRLIREVKEAQIRLNLLTGLKGIKGIRGLNKKSKFLNEKCQSGQQKLILDWLDTLRTNLI